MRSTATARNLPFRHRAKVTQEVCPSSEMSGRHPRHWGGADVPSQQDAVEGYRYSRLLLEAIGLMPRGSACVRPRIASCGLEAAEASAACANCRHGQRIDS